MAKYRFRPFATEDYAETSPVWSPGGKSIAYAAFGLRVKSLDGSPPVSLGHAGTQPSWSPDESRLYYVKQTGLVYGLVFFVSRAGGEPTQITQGEAFAAAISPDGRTLAALMKEETGGQRHRVLTLFSPPESSGKRLADFPGWAAQHRLAWSRDGSKILIWLQAPSSIWLANVRSGNVKQIASPPSTISLGFSWFPDNCRVAISWPRADTSEGRTDLWVLDTDTGHRTLLIPSTEDVTNPSVSPDGRAIAFQSGARDFDLIELPLDGSSPRPLLVTKQWEDSADWSPVAPEYVYISQDAIWLRRRDSSGHDSDPHLVVNAAALSSGEEAFRFVSPSFSPDGTRIAYAAGAYQSRARRGWISPASGGAPAPLGQFPGTVGGLTWSRDGRWIAFNWTPSEAAGGRLAKIRVGSGQPMILEDESCAFSPEWSPDSSRILCSKGGVLYTISAEGGERDFLGKEYEPIATWSRDIRYIYAIRNANGRRQFGKLDWKGGPFQPLTDIPAEWTINTPLLGGARLSLSPDGKSLATTVIRPAGDIWILEGFQPPPTLWQRLWRH